ncbi:MAG: hypothetical protein ABII25_02590 [bacterium]
MSIKDILKKWKDVEKKERIIIYILLSSVLIPILTGIKWRDLHLVLTLDSVINFVVAPLLLVITLLVCFYALAMVSSQIGDWPFTKCKENRAKMLIGWGDKVVDLIYNSDDFDILKIGWKSVFKRKNVNGVPINEKGEKADRRNKKPIIYQRNRYARFYNFILSLIGLEDIKWVGLFNRVRKYHFEYDTIEKDGKTGKMMLKHHDVNVETPWIFLNWVRFGFEMKSVESLSLDSDSEENKEQGGKAAIPLDLIGGVVLRIENLRQAILGIDNWLAVTMDILKSQLIKYVAQNTFETLAKENISIDLLNRATNGSGKTAHQTIQEYGIVAREIYLANIDFSDKKDAARQKAKWAEKKQAEAVVEKAKGEARATEERRIADVQYLGEVCAIQGGAELTAVRISLEKAKVNKEMEENYNSTIQGTVKEAKPGVILNISRQGNANTNDAIDTASLMELKQLNKDSKKEAKDK